jgi:peroxiredoxin
MLNAGELAPDFQLPSAAGSSISLRSLLERSPVLVAFFKISCPTCQYTLPFLERISSGGRIVILGVSQDDAEDTNDFAASVRLSFPLAIDGIRTGYAVSSAYRITNVPSLFLVEQGGKIASAWSGFSRPDLEELGRRIGVSAFQPGEQTPQFKPG